MISKERRGVIRNNLDSGRIASAPQGEELRALLDLADERDRYRALLEEARPYLKAHGWSLHHKADRGEDRYGHVYGDQAWSLLTEIDAALEDT